MPWYKQSGAFQRRAAANHQLQWPFARGGGELPLLKAGKSAILGPKPPESGEWGYTSLPAATNLSSQGNMEAHYARGATNPRNEFQLRGYHILCREV